MFGFGLSFITALLNAGTGAVTKRSFNNGLKVKDMGFLSGKMLLVIPFVSIPLIFVPMPEIGKSFYLAMAIALPIEVIAQILQIKAIKSAPLSHTMPFLSFTPIFMVPIGFFILKESISVFGIIGILFVVMGAYFVNISELKEGIAEPFKAIFKEKGSLLMVIVAFLFALTTVLSKVAILNSGSIFFGAAYVFALTFVSFVISFIFDKKVFHNIYKDRREIVKPAFFEAMTNISQNIAIRYVPSAYFIAIKRTSIVFSVIIGKIFFKEEKIKGPVIGSVLMVVGVVCIVVVG